MKAHHKAFLEDNTKFYEEVPSNGVVLDWPQIHSVYMITMPSRREESEKIINDMGLTGRVNILEAINGQTLNPELLRKKGILKGDDGKAWSQGMMWSKGEMGCALSHLAVMNHFLSKNPPKDQMALVFEDDIYGDAAVYGELSSFFREVKEMQQNGGPTADILYPGYCWDRDPENGMKKRWSNGPHLKEPRDNLRLGENLARLLHPICLHAYAVNPSAAMSSLDKAFPIEKPIDCYLAGLVTNQSLVAVGPIAEIVHQNRRKYGSETQTGGSIDESGTPMILYGLIALLLVALMVLFFR